MLANSVNSHCAKFVCIERRDWHKLNGWPSFDTGFLHKQLFLQNVLVLKSQLGNFIQDGVDGCPVE